MPKKHRQFHIKPASNAHPSLASGRNHNDGTRGSGGSTASVNDLISHLRRTQAPSADDNAPVSQRPRSVPTLRSVHPSLRNLLEIPETPPPRPRPGARRTAIGARRIRPTAGPPPPGSWLKPRSDGLQHAEHSNGCMGTIVYRLKRLPGGAFPDHSDLMHLVLKTMALNWTWHVDYDGPFLSQLPNHLKGLLLSYIAVFARGQPLNEHMNGLKPLFLTQLDQQITDEEAQFDDLERDAGTTRLDLGGAIGNWMSLKQLKNELIISNVPVAGASGHEEQEDVPTSWDEEEVDGNEDDKDVLTNLAQSPSIPKQVTERLRFQKLQSLSLAHPNPEAASWPSLLKLLSRLTNLNQLSLAHWPTPTRTPNATNARIRHPTIRSLTFSYSGTDNYATLDNNWAEVASVLRQLSRSTQCLKWLDLEGCATWLPALNWVGEDPDGVPYRPDAVGPDWNGAWRGVEWIGLGPGWIPNLADDNPPPRSPDPADPPWLEEEQANARRLKKLDTYRNQFQTALAVRKHLRMIRKEGRGKWLHVSLGLDDVDPQIVKQLVGQDYALHE